GIQRSQIELGFDVPLLGRTEIPVRHFGVSALVARIGNTSTEESYNRGYEKNPKHGLRQSLPDFAAGLAANNKTILKKKHLDAR
ncbi:hypothetical protein, partial [Acinetobacter baumannii]|uniref:hypothetical protein n=1 Tax=Acinetobacter baumannii TaxID=470 RepID=UPI001BB46ADE